VVIEFQVRDTGCGIPESQLIQLFKGVIQVDTADTPEEGRAAGKGPKGLGLVVCKKLVEMMDGSISVESRVGKGSAFTFSIAFNPALKPKHSPVNTAPLEIGEKVVVGLYKKEQRKNHELSEGFSAIFPLKILLAEDNEINQRLTLKILEKLGYQAELAHHGKEVLEMVAHKDYDVILMDVQMPEMDGLEATRMVRLCLQKQPVIIAMTANAMDGDRDDCIQAGMDDYISKPVELDELIRQLEKWGRAIQLKRPINS
jgi:CheY-like chemotaxis protein